MKVHQFKGLGFLAWVATLGAWGPTRKALKHVEEPAQSLLREQINRLMHRCVLEDRFFFGDINARSLLKETIPALFEFCSAEEIVEALRIANAMTEKRKDPHNLLAAVPNLKKLLSAREDFSLALAIASLEAQRGRDPADSLAKGFGVPQAKDATTSSEFELVSKWAHHLIGKGINPEYSLQAAFGLLRAKKSLTSARYSTAVPLVGRLFLEQGVSPVVGFGYLCQLRKDEEFIEGLELFSSLAKNRPQLDWSEVSEQEFLSLVQDAIRIKRDGLDYEIVVKPGQTYVERQLRADVYDTDWDSGGHQDPDFKIGPGGWVRKTDSDYENVTHIVRQKIELRRI